MTRPDNVAGIAPEEFSKGLPDDFDGVLVDSRYVLWDYNGEYDPQLFVRNTYKPDNAEEFLAPGEETFTDHLSCGRSATPDRWLPTDDGESPTADPEDEDTWAEGGKYALRVGDKKKLAGGTAYHFFNSKAVEAGFPGAKLMEGTPSVFNGTRAHFNRQKPKSSGEYELGEVLIMTDNVEVAAEAKAGKKKSKAKSKAKTKAKSKAADVDGDLSAAIAVALAEAEDGVLKKTQLVQIAAGAGIGPKAIQRAGQADFLGNDEYDGVLWTYDADSGSISAVEE